MKRKAAPGAATEPGDDFRACVAELAPRLRAFARLLVRDRALTDDLVQDTLLRAMEREQDWQAGTNLRAWLFRILRNRFVDETRRRRVERRIAESVAAPAAEAPRQADADALRDLDRALAALPPAQREALILVAALDMSVAEAAEIAGVAEGTIKARVSRARAALAVRLAPAEGA